MKISYMKELMAFDLKLRKKVEDAHKRKLNIKSELDNSKKTISIEAWENARNEVKKIKLETEHEISENDENNYKEYENRVNEMSDAFLKNNDIWKKHIMSAIFEKENE
ncbi:MAG: hypothetical protein ACK5KQ_07160 [Anaerorhabdus sp.]